MVLFIAFFAYSAMSAKSSQSADSNIQYPPNQKVKLADTKFARNSYLISGETLTAQQKDAISGFNLTREVLPDNSLNITLVALSTEYQSQNYIVQPGESLYFIETYMGDDSPPTGEGPSLMDDHAIIVDKDGYVLSPLPAK